MPDEQQPSRREPEAWETSALGPYLTIRAAGPLDGRVSITATGIDGHVVIEAAWGSRYARRWVSVERADHAAADKLAHHWADELVAGRAPLGD